VSVPLSSLDLVESLFVIYVCPSLLCADHSESILGFSTTIFFIGEWQNSVNVNASHTHTHTCL
jgi:hypothetical protein